MMEALPRMTKIVSGRGRERFLVRRKLIIGGGALISGLSIRPSIVIAQAGNFSGARKINFSGRQRMLIQRAGKLVCLAHLAPKPLPLLIAAEEALELYHRTEAGLREGDEGLGLEPEANARVLQALAQSSNAFAPYGETISDAIERRLVEPGHVQKIAELNGPALNAMDAAVNLIERIYQNQEMSEQLAMLINISGRQRMLSQRMVLQLCLHHIAISSNDLLQELLITMNRFNAAMNILQRVTLAALRGQISKQIIQRLSAAQGEWRTLRAFLSMAMMSGSKQSIGDLLDADRRAEDLLGKMNEIVLLYEKAAG